MKQVLKITGIVIVLTGLIICCFYWLLGQQVPFKIANEFINAIQNKDWNTVVRLIHPVEKEKLFLNHEQVKIIGENLILPIWNKLGLSVELKRIENPFNPTTKEEYLHFKNMHFFQIFRNNKEDAVILVAKTDEGYRVNYSFFVYTMLIVAADRGILHQEQVRPILRKVGIFQIFIGKESAPLLP